MKELIFLFPTCNVLFSLFLKCLLAGFVLSIYQYLKQLLDYLCFYKYYQDAVI